MNVRVAKWIRNSSLFSIAGVDGFDSVSPHIVASILRQRRRLKNREYMKKQMHVASVMIKVISILFGQQVALMRA
jgi:hypothetical protein